MLADEQTRMLGKIACCKEARVPCLSSLPVARRSVPDCDASKAQAYMRFLWPRSTCRQLPVLTSHIRPLLSKEPLAMKPPHALIHTLLTMPVCASSGVGSLMSPPSGTGLLPLSPPSLAGYGFTTSHMCTEPLACPLARMSRLGHHARLRTMVFVAFNTCRMHLCRGSQI